MPYCSMHLTDYALGTMCPECRRERDHDTQQELIELRREQQRDAESQHDELINSLREAEHRRLNPGSYQCEACMLTTLLDGASRCPICRADVRPEYWPSVRARERRARETVVAAKKAAEDTRKKVCDAAIATIKLGIAHTEQLWEETFREAKMKHEAQRGFSRWFAPLPPPVKERYYRFHVTECGASKGTWTTQPVLILGIRTFDNRHVGFKHYRFATPYEYIAVFQYLKTTEEWSTSTVDHAITGFQRWCDQDWRIVESDSPQTAPTVQDYTELLERYRVGAAHGDAASQYELGRLHANGHGLPQDYVEALRWYRKAADLKHPGAHRNIGLMHANGQAVSQNYTEAMRWYHKAADLGDVVAARWIGVMYANGEGIPKDFSEAMKWYRKAVDQGDAWAALNIGRMYHRGQGVSRDESNALIWYRHAADLGDAEARFNAKFYIDLIGGKFDR
jgi:TPR repeat protein